MSFLGVVKQDLQDVEQAALNAGKTMLDYIDGVVVHDLVPALEVALTDMLKKLSQEALAELLTVFGKSLPPAQ